MSGPITIDDGGLATKDPNDISVVVFDWDARHLATSVTIATSDWTITGVSGDITTTPLTSDQASILSGTRKTQVRLSAGAAGSKWKVENAIVTSESPSQTKNRKFFVKVEDL
jgi:hypothetical protein